MVHGDCRLSLRCRSAETAALATGQDEGTVNVEAGPVYCSLVLVDGVTEGSGGAVSWRNHIAGPKSITDGHARKV